MKRYWQMGTVLGLGWRMAQSVRAAESQLYYRMRFGAGLMLCMLIWAPLWGQESPQLKSLLPEAVFSVLDLAQPELAAVKSAIDRGDQVAALEALLAHYRARFPLPAAGSRTGEFPKADDIVNHIFQWGPYTKADYGPEMDWEWDPRGDIEWVAAIYRFYWATELSRAYERTRNEKYAQAFVDLTTDWIEKHPLENWEKTHPVYKSWKGFAWLDIQTGRRARSLCAVFPVLVNAQAFTPEFLGIFLASMYDHQEKTEKIPRENIVHNKAIFEQLGFVEVAALFPEFKASRRWLSLALDRTHESLMAQTTSDGVQREWCGGYHRGVLFDAVDIMQRLDAADIDVPADYRDLVRLMYDYLFWMATPDLGYPMFGDTSRPLTAGWKRSRLPLYSTFLDATVLLKDPKYAARSGLSRASLPKQTSAAFQEAGMYALRNDWGPDQVYMALHCSPPAISGHDQPDNGTFELYAYGRWLMPDTGFYTYGHDAQARAWHRQTTVHQTLTLDGEDAAVDGRQLLWQSDAHLDVVTVENQSYPGLTHRRTVWFVDRQFYVILDEAIGDASGTLDVHFQMAPGNVYLGVKEKQAVTLFSDANVMVYTDPDAPVTMEKEEGWFAWAYGERMSRKAFRFCHTEEAPAAFLTLVVPYKGERIPRVAGRLPDDFLVGADVVTLSVSAFDRQWEIGRDLLAQTGFAQRVVPRAVDFNGDASVDFLDFLAFAQVYDKRQADADFDARFDLDADGHVGFSDFLVFASAFGHRFN